MTTTETRKQHEAGHAVRVPLFKVFMSERAKSAVADVLDSGYVGQGPKVDEFEAALKCHLSSDRDVLTVNSCTSALELALYMIGVGPGDEVLTTPLTCTASNGAIVRSGATPVWCDVKPNGLIDPESVAKAMGPRVKAIMAVDWAGWPCDYDRLNQFGVPVIQDAAHSFGARYQGRQLTDRCGIYVCYSFQAIKHLNTADGGAIVCPADQVDRARLLRWYGLDRRSGAASFRCGHQNIKEAGFKMHMNDVAAAIGIENLKEVNRCIGQAIDNANFYDRELPAQSLVHSTADQGSCWIYNVAVPERERFEQAMRERNLFDASPVHARNDIHDGFRRVAVERVPLTGLNFFSKHMTAIPNGWWVTREQREMIAEQVRLWCR